jgi:hypothetical protein
MDCDGDDFGPRLGKMRATRAKRAHAISGVSSLLQRLRGKRAGKGSIGFDGSRIGRGAPVGRLLFAAREDVADGGKFLERCRDDRHQFRFIVSVEEGDLMADLKVFARRLMAQMEEDLGAPRLGGGRPFQHRPSA